MDAPRPPRNAYVSSETREVVQRAIRERGYQTGARPRAGRTGLIGIMVPLLHPGYFAEILSGAAEALYEHDMRVVLCPTRHSRRALRLTAVAAAVAASLAAGSVAAAGSAQASAAGPAAAATQHGLGPGTRFFIPPPSDGAPQQRLLEADVQNAQGFFLNVSNYQPTPQLADYGTWISDCVAMVTDSSNAYYNNPSACASQYYPATPADFSTWSLTTQWYAQNMGNAVAATHFVIDTSRNGRGPDTMQQYASAPYDQPASVVGTLASGNWCNPPESGLGIRPTANTGVPLLDAYLWVKTPGQSDGQCDSAAGVRAWDYSDYTQPEWPTTTSASPYSTRYGAPMTRPPETGSVRRPCNWPSWPAPRCPGRDRDHAAAS